MKLFQRLLVAPAALGLLAPLASNASDVNLNDISKVSSTYPNHKHLITIKTICSGKFGNSITFRATKGYPFFKHPRVLPELNQRIRNAKQES